MLIVTAKVPQRRYFLLIALAVLAVLLFVAIPRGQAADPSGKRAENNASRIAYLESLGWEVVTEPLEALRFTLPDELIEPYRSYNELQLRQDFDLAPYCGETVERYTYTVTNYPGRSAACQADLYLFNGEIIAGDIVCTGEDGFLAPLAFPAEGKAEGS